MLTRRPDYQVPEVEVHEISEPALFLHLLTIETMKEFQEFQEFHRQIIEIHSPKLHGFDNNFSSH
jgi:hypothetical protein